MLTGAPVVTAEPSAQQLASRVVGGAARATGGRPANDPDWWRQLAAALGCLAVVFVVGLWVKGQGPQELGSFSGVLHSFGRLTALLSSVLLLIQVVLMARVPFLERGFGQDAIVRTHRFAGFTSFNLLLAHIVLSTLGYAASTQLGIWGTLVDFVVNYPGMLLAVAGTVALTMVVVTSIRRARARLRYETWHLLHLYAYLGVGLALPHQLWTGQDFVGNLAATVFWWTLYAVALGCVVGFRLVLPLVRSYRHRLVVEEVRRETLGVTSVVVSGRDLDRLGARAGQYLLWRFLDRPGWTRAHPFSLSAAPDGSRLRITAVHVGARLDRSGPPPPRRAGPRRRPVRTAARRRPDRRQGAAHGVGHRGHPDAGAPRGAAAATRATSSSSTGSTRRPTCCSGTSWPRWRPSAARGS